MRLARLVWMTLVLLPAAAMCQNVITTVAGQPFVFRGAGGQATSAPIGNILGVAINANGDAFVADAGNNLVLRIATSGVVTIIAGNGLSGFSGDGGIATSASLAVPAAVTIGGGALYIADSFNHRVRRVNNAGIITTIAGNGRRGFAGDGGPATSASLNNPSGLVLDPAGNLYIADRGNHRVRKVAPDGTITTYAGNGTAGFSGDNGPATAASLHFLEPVTSSGHSGLAFDRFGNLYIADRENHRVRRVGPNGVITTIAGNGVNGTAGDGGPALQAALGGPRGIAVDGSQNVLVSQTNSLRIRLITQSGTISRIAGTGVLGFAGDGGPASAAQFNFPEGLALDSAASLYIADSFNFRLRKITLPALTISTIAGNGQFRYSGDGGPATSAAFSSPAGVTVDAAGNVYVADRLNHRVRRIDGGGTVATVAGNGDPLFAGDGGPAASAGVQEPLAVDADASGNIFVTDSRNHRIRKFSVGGAITTVAGNGTLGFSGDGGPATSAMLNNPNGVAAAPGGGFFIVDRSNQRVRGVSSTGTISTAAGSGSVGFSGDNGPATSASLGLTAPDFPFLEKSGVTVDAAGNMYFADRFNHRIRKVTPGGTITTVAGNGQAGFSGDNGPATAASLNDPVGIAVDGAGNLFIADSDNHRVRRVGADGIITTVAGNGISGSSGDGGLATAARLSSPRGVAVDAAGNIYVADTGTHRIRKVLVSAPSLSASPGTLAVSLQAGDSAVPREISIGSSAAGVRWTATASTAGGGPWLSVTPSSGSAPGTASATFNVAGLAPGTYRGSITISAPQASPPSVTVNVDVTVSQAAAAELRVEPAGLTFETPGAGRNPRLQALRIANSGGGNLEWTARVETVNGGAWLSISAASGTATLGNPSVLQVSAVTTGLAAGVYTGTIRVVRSATAQEISVPVTLVIPQSAQTILVSQSGLLYTGVQGGRQVPSQNFGILNVGQGRMDWRLEARTLSGGNWLSVSTINGSSQADSLEIPLVDVNVDVTGMAAGQYSGVVRVISDTATNSPQVVTVELTVLPPGSNPGVLVRPTGLIFAAQAGTSSPGSQTVRVASAKPGTIEARSGVLTFDGGDWLESAPRNAVITPADPQTLTIQPELGDLAPGVYRSAVTMLFSDGSPSQVVNALFLVTSQAFNAVRTAGDSGDSERVVSQCEPRRLHAMLRSLSGNFSAPVSWPVTVEMQVVDDCGSAVPNAAAIVTFSSGDPPLPLNSLRNGVYIGTWRPLTAGAVVTARARATLGTLEPAEVQAQGQVLANASAPLLFTGGVVNGASYSGGATVAPGAIVSVFGRNLARGLNAATQVPLATNLGGATLLVGGQEAPLFFSSDGQINAQLPFELTPNTRAQVVVRTLRDGSGPETLTVPDTITVAAAQPGCFSMNQQGTGQGAILDVQFRLVDASNPATRGNIVQVYCTGLGQTNPRVQSGSRPPAAEPLARVVTPVQATVGGVPATVHFAGLAPGFVGLYQVNLEIPAGVTPGPSVPLVLTQNGIPSNPVTLAVR